MPRVIDVAGIVNGTLTQEEALWQIGSSLLGHTNHVIAIHHGATTGEAIGGYGGASSTNLDGAWLEYGPKGVQIEMTFWPDKGTVWKTTWPPVVALLRPHLKGAILDEVLAAAHARRDHISARPNCWETRTPEELEQERKEFHLLEQRCYAAAAAAWLAAAPDRPLW